MLSKVYTKGYGLDIVMPRSFNHIGPGQKEIFVITSFAKRLVEIKKEGTSSPKLITGDISLIRDFVDVRDVVKIKRDIGWTPEIPLRRSLEDVIYFWNRR